APAVRLPQPRSLSGALVEAVAAAPVPPRPLDPPLHEFLPKREELMVEVAELRSALGKKRGSTALKAKLSKAERLLARVEELHEFNPMLGHRGCRLGITYPEITEMQARAILEASSDDAAQ